MERHDSLPADVGDLPGARRAGRGAPRRHRRGRGSDSSSSWRSRWADIVHVGTDTIAHSFVNEQCGGPYRDHPTRHHLIENHIDAWNYAQTGAGRHDPGRPLGQDRRLPRAVVQSALWFAVQLTPDDPRGRAAARRRSSDDPDDRKKQLDVDGEMPDWMAKAIVLALMETFPDSPAPADLPGRRVPAGDRRRASSPRSSRTSTGHGLDRPVPGAARRDRAAAAVPGADGLPVAVGGRDRLPADDTLYKLQLQRRRGSCRNHGYPTSSSSRRHPTSRTCSSRRTSPASTATTRSRTSAKCSSRWSSGSSRRSPRSSS